MLLDELPNDLIELLCMHYLSTESCFHLILTSKRFFYFQSVGHSHKSLIHLLVERLQLPAVATAAADDDHLHLLGHLIRHLHSRCGRCHTWTWKSALCVHCKQCSVCFVAMHFECSECHGNYCNCDVDDSATRQICRHCNEIFCTNCFFENHWQQCHCGRTIAACAADAFECASCSHRLCRKCSKLCQRCSDDIHLCASCIPDHHTDCWNQHQLHCRYNITFQGAPGDSSSVAVDARSDHRWHRRKIQHRTHGSVTGGRSPSEGHVGPLRR